ncbi:glucose-1-phosphate thymidylyltransferase [Candidatus Bathyarchaeota archaeon]|nr:glucose-1-phosphate thymidylyltransferase [Candidatus Bathyarchaeota archaeon]
MKGVILHGGRGTRLRPLTHTGPKQLIPIANKPMSQYALEDLRNSGITDIAVVLGDVAPEKVIEYYGDGSKFGVRLTYIHQGEPRGIAHAVGLARDFVGDDPFIVYLGDNLIKGGIKSHVEDFRKSSAAAHIALCHVRNPEAFGVAELDNKGRIMRLVEKPKTPSSDLALVGIYMFRSSIFDAIDRLRPSWRGELEITDAIQGLLEMGLEVSSHVISGWWKDTGRPEDILEANHLILSDLTSYNKGKLEDEVAVTGKIAIEEGTVIKSKSTLRGPLIIGRDCEVGPCTYVGPYTSIGDNVVIRGGEVENSIVLSNALIDCGKRIVDSLVGRESRVVSNETTLPKGYRLVIGENTSITL